MNERVRTLHVVYILVGEERQHKEITMYSAREEKDKGSLENILVEREDPEKPVRRVGGYSIQWMNIQKTSFQAEGTV